MHLRNREDNKKPGSLRGAGKHKRKDDIARELTEQSTPKNSPIRNPIMEKNCDTLLQDTAEEIIAKTTAREVFLRPKSSLDMSERSFTTVQTIMSNKQREKKNTSKNQPKRPNPFGTLRSEKSVPLTEKMKTPEAATTQRVKVPVLSLLRIQSASGYSTDMEKGDMSDDASNDAGFVKGFRITLEGDEISPPEDIFGRESLPPSSPKQTLDGSDLDI